MEINFQTQQSHTHNQNIYQFQTQTTIITPPTTPKGQSSKPKSKSKKTNPTKFLGVRQRPSGRWVAEIKDTTQKIRMWLGTFETAEEAARAYDEAACLLRGSNTRTNFSTQKLSPNSPIASRIRAQLNDKKLKNQNLESSSSPSTPKTPKTPSSSVQSFSISSSTNVGSPSFSATSNMLVSNSNPFESNPLGNVDIPPICFDNYQNAALLDEEVYKPCFANGGDEFGQLELTPLLMDQTWMYEPAGFDRFGLEVPESSISNSSFSEFDRLKLQEYFDKLLFDQCDNTLLDYQSQMCHLSCRT